VFLFSFSLLSPRNVILKPQLAHSTHSSACKLSPYATRHNITLLLYITGPMTECHGSDMGRSKDVAAPVHKHAHNHSIQTLSRFIQVNQNSTKVSKETSGAVFLQAGRPFSCPTISVKALKVYDLHVQQ